MVEADDALADPQQVLNRDGLDALNHCVEVDPAIVEQLATQTKEDATGRVLLVEDGMACLLYTSPSPRDS